MSREDPRVDFLHGAILSTFSLRNSNHDTDALFLKTVPQVVSFLEEGPVSLLCVSASDDVKMSDLSFTNKLAVGKTTDTTLVFSKLQPISLTPDNIHKMAIVCSLTAPPAASLYHVVQKVYAPLLTKDATWSQTVDSKLQTLLGSLEASLGTLLRSGKGAQLDSIRSVADEFAHWSDLRATAPDLAAREQAQFFHEAFSSVAKDFDAIDTLTLDKLLELATATQDCLNEVWEPPEHGGYPEDRMRHLMRVVGQTLCQALRNAFAKTDFWGNITSSVRDDLRTALAVLDQWSRRCRALTASVWTARRKWTGEPYTDTACSQLSARLTKVLELRAIHEQLCQLLTPEERAELDLDACFQVFAGINLLQQSAYDDGWEAAVKRFESRLQPAETRVSAKMHARLRDVTSHAQLVYEFKRSAELLSRPRLRQELIAEREKLCGQLAVQARALRDEFQKRNGIEGGPAGKNLPEIVSAIVFAKQLDARTEGVRDTARKTVDDLPAGKDVLAACDSLAAELQAHAAELFEGWERDTLQQLDDRDSGLTLETTVRLMEFDQRDRKLCVHYGDKLVSLLRETRQLAALGFTINPKIHKAAQSAAKFYRYAVLLKQVANFYNTIHEQVIPSQLPMLESHARAFEALIKHPKGKAADGKYQLTWSNTEELKAYTDKLQAAVTSFSAQNRKLRKLHMLFGDKVIELMNTDLLRAEKTWTDGIGSLRTHLAALREEGVPAEAINAWALHWDHQLYKALEHQYHLGLESLHETLPEISVDLVFRQQKLQLRPPMEEVRARYYREVKRFLCIPETFRGLTDTRIFAALMQRSARGYEVMYKKAEALFNRLGKAVAHFKDWVVLGMVDLDEMVSDISDVIDWEYNFRSIKQKGREAEKLPSVIKVDCIKMSTQPVKTTIEEQQQRFFDALVNSIRKAINRDIASIDDFVARGTTALGARPQTVAEIGAVNAAHAQLSSEKLVVRQLFDAIDRKNRLLRSVIGASVDIVAIQARWDRLDLMLESHALMVREQTDAMKAGVTARVDAFLQSVSRFKSRWDALRPQDSALETRDSAKKAIATIKEKQTEFGELCTQAEAIVQDCSHFELPPPDFTEVDAVKAELNGLDATWGLLEEFLANLEAISKEDWLSFRGRTYLFSDLLDQWAARLRASTPSMVTVRIRADLEKYTALVPCLKYLRGDAFADKHWIDMFKAIGVAKATPIEELTLDHFLTVADKVIASEAFLKDLHARAQGEVSLREALRELDKWGETASFAFAEYTDVSGGKMHVIKDWKEITTALGEHQCLLQSLKDSPFFAGFADQVAIWEARLAAIDGHVMKLNAIQRRWVYLEPIFGRGALPKEQNRFRAVDSDFRTILGELFRDERILSLANKASLGATLETTLDQAVRCQKALNEYLEEKRSIFPRFYFIGDEDLLEILGQATDPTVIQTHLKKLFAGIHTVGFDANKKSVVAMNSQDGEIVPLVTPVQLSTSVEAWLGLLSTAMVKSLSTMLEDCVADSRAGGVDPSKYPSQILCIADQIQFTSNVEAAITTNGLPALHKSLQAKLEAYTGAAADTGDEGGVLELKLKALIMDLIHMIEVVDLLANNKVNNLSAWLWQKQLRYYPGTGGGPARIAMCNAAFDYTYEYQGNSAKLVHTPLTDKCYLTLTQGMHMGYGGNPYGPAGTGKTESVKALGGAFGRQVLVFNCDEGIDVKSMGRIFVGLVKCGAWGCFDEFNRLEEGVLSAVSTQIQIIQAAIRERAATTELMERTVSIDPNAGIFITMNPAGKGYGGRQKLPDNLKQLFRPVAMTVPDLEQISEVVLFSEGFREGKALGRKLVALYTLSRELLSRQQHYDWGLRALKASLRAGGHLLLTRRRTQPGVQVPPTVEAELIVQAVRVNTLSKLTYSDALRFDALVKDIFPGTQLADIEYPALTQALRDAYTHLGLQYSEKQVKKVLELYELLRQRMGVVIVGPSGSGKTALRTILRTALAKINKEPKQYAMNPKAMPRPRLLGHIDHDTREWFDGVITASARAVVKEPLEVTSWIVCDGDIDPEWVESLNSVLDDNRLLTMPSGERIQFGPNVNFVFETNDLSCASPATVSRMGMIFLSDEDLDAKAVVATWLKQQTEQCQNALPRFLDDYFYRALDWVSAKPCVVPQGRLGRIRNGLSLLPGTVAKAEVLFALLRGFGGNMAVDIRTDFAKELFSWAHESLPDPRRPLDITLTNGRLVALQATFQDDSIDYKSVVAGEALVRTVEIQKSLAVIQDWLRLKDNFIVVGPEGCGKLVMLQHAFRNLRATSTATIFCSAQTSPDDVIQKLTMACMPITTNSGRIFRPKDGDTLILFLKDVNLVKPDKWGTSALVTFLQQLLTYRGFHDDNLEWVGLEGVQIVISINPSSTLGRCELTTRFSSLTRVLYVDYPDRNQLQEIYAAMLGPIITHKLSPKHEMASSKSITRLASLMASVYEQLRAKFSVDDHKHYRFSPKILTRWVIGLQRYNLAELPPLEVVANEAARIFRDLLVANHCDAFDGILVSSLKTDWSYTPPSAVPSDDGTYFVSFAPCESKAGEARPLQKINDAQMRSLLDAALLSYSREYARLDLPLYPEALVRLTAIDRVLSSSGGSLILAGRCGASRRALVTLAAYMLKIEIVSPKVSRTYTTKHFKQDIKTVLGMAGGAEARSVVLLLEDHHFVEDSFYELINSVLSTGEIPGLFKPDELDVLIGPLKDAAAQEGWRGSVYTYFLSRVRANLKVVMILDSSRWDFHQKCESNPAFYSNCTMLWMDRLRPDSMGQVTRLTIGSTFDAVGTAGSGAAEVPALARTIHEMFADKGATPKHFANMLQLSSSLFTSKLSTLRTQEHRFESGLAKLHEATSMVDELKAKALVQSKQLSVKKSEAEQTMVDIQDNMGRASRQKIDIETIKGQLAVEETKLAQRKKAIDAELSSIEPLLEAARSAVGQIKSDSLSEIRALRAPPDTIRDILQGVLGLMGIYDTSWGSMRNFLAKRGVTEDIIHFDARRVTPEMRERVQELIRTRESSFQAENAKRANVAAAPLAKWVLANMQFSEVLEKIGPLEAESNKLQQHLEQSQERLKSLSAEVETIDRAVKELTARYGVCTADCARLQLEYEQSQSVITSAEGLISKLDGERQRWAEQAKTIKASIASLPLKALLAAGFITYLGDATEDVREATLQQWASHARLASFDFLSFMSTESEQLSWKAEGLPSDRLSLENAAAMLASTQAPLLVDPGQRATEWLKKHMKEMRFEVINQQDANFVTALELALRFGKKLLVQEVDTIEPLLMPILRRDLVPQGPRFCIYVGDKLVDFNEDFQLFISTRNSEIDVGPHLRGIVNTVNFTTTRAGLANQLLVRTIQHEKPQLEERKTELLASEDRLKMQLAEMEETLLAALAASSGNILQNQPLLDSLTDIKAKSQVVAEALAESIRLQTALDGERGVYLPLAHHGSKLFFVVQKLAMLNHMYQFSLASFLALYDRALAHGERTTDQTTRIKSLSSHLVQIAYEEICNSLFRGDRLTYAMILVHGMCADQFAPNEWEFFTGQLAAPDAKKESDRLPSWVPAARVNALQSFLSQFPDAMNSMQLRSPDIWAGWIENSHCEDGFSSSLRLRAFQEVLLVHVLRPDRLISAMTRFCCKLLGLKELLLPSPALRTVYERSTTAAVPTLIIVSPGTDPSQELRDLAASVVGKDALHEVAMGQGQADTALAQLRECAHSGAWLVLKNLHLVWSWLPVLEKEINALRPHASFRLWCTSESHPKFAPVLLQTCLKITLEAPPGIKRNLMRTIEGWTPDELKANSPATNQALFALALLHATLQERRVFIPQGWTKFYEFSTSDFVAASKTVERVCAAAEGGRGVRWEDVHGLLSEAVYGGRIDNSFDADVLRGFLTLFFTGDDSRAHRPAPLCQGVSMPASKSIDDYKSIVRNFPEQDSPYMFALPANIDRSLQVTLGLQSMQQLRLLTRATHLGSSFNREAWTTALMPVLDLWKRMSQGQDFGKVSVPVAKETADPLAAFVTGDRALAVSILRIVAADFAELAKVLKGVALLSPHVLAVGSALVQGETPGSWQRLWEGPDDSAGWLRAVLARFVALGALVEHPDATSLLKSPIDLASFLRPDVFLNALRQLSARLLKVPIDTLKMSCTWGGVAVPGARVAAQLSGLQLEGATFDGTRLGDVSETSPNLCQLPSCNVAWVDQKDAPKMDGLLRTPLYMASDRGRVVANLTLPCEKSTADKWVRTAIALFMKDI
eukprot:m.191084 g.191084  ORF g.191084 m.191084 type:complete len:4245 (+) comp15437_c5_seq48:84-12818(+)